MIGRTFAVFGLVAVLCGTSAAAEGDYARRGWYVGGGATYAFEEFRTGDADVRVDDSAGFKVLGGYRAHPNVAAEIDLDYLHDFEVRYAGLRGQIRGVATTINGKGYLTRGRVQPYGVAGLGALYVTGHDASLRNVLGLSGGVLGRLGGGLDVYATEHVVLTPRRRTLCPPATSRSSGTYR